MRTKKDLMDSADKSMLSKNPKEVLRKLEEDLITSARIGKGDIDNVAFWRTPDTPKEFDEFVRKYASVVVYWGLQYNAQFRIAKLAEEEYNAYVHSKRDRCYKEYVSKRSDSNGKLNKQPTKEDYDQIFRDLFGKKKEFNKLKRIMEREKEVRDKLETIYVTAKLYKDLLVVSGNLQINLLSRGVISPEGFTKRSKK